MNMKQLSTLKWLIEDGKDILDIIRQEKQAKNMSDYRLAAEAGLDKTTTWRALHSDKIKSPTIDIVLKLARAVDLEITATLTPWTDDSTN